MLKYIKMVLRHIRWMLHPDTQTRHYNQINSDNLWQSWQQADIVAKQDMSQQQTQQALQSGELNRTLQAFKTAMQAIPFDNQQSILEIGCSTGYYVTIFNHLFPGELDYTGTDYSAAMIDAARQRYPDHPFFVADAAALPIPDNAYDMVLSAGVLMFVQDYQRAIAETVRTARDWCIFHRIPTLPHHKTVYLSGDAYGVDVATIYFQEAELRRLFQQNGLTLHAVYDIDKIDRVRGEPVMMKTYLCRRENR